MLTAPLSKHPQYTALTLTTTAVRDSSCYGVTEHRVTPRRHTELGPCAFLPVTAIVLLWWRYPNLWQAGPILLPATAFTLALALTLASCWRVRYQSVTPLAGLGIQLATARGFGVGPKSTERKFVPLDDISTVIIHEGLRRWNVRYYLGVVKKRGDIVVAFDAVHPHPEVLRQVYHCVREVLFDEYADETGDTSETNN
ncbi:hypothetical protein CspeluHIS016_0210850 [Cutaneotrichosporon spelunceum]|uniref:Phosphatidylinositol N-acetylglucosaminyltransferase subunit H conserved domain-containing protein n=1 Tax=Cutaneotrichosporon spelunceum TaxID=1672016 RepID=A0AAD3TSV8_9TREE|nr:hypothetical protein CspeluHIS016_0210850 [Cutaneotrichosporon spelunceum]